MIASADPTAGILRVDMLQSLRSLCGDRTRELHIVALLLAVTGQIIGEDNDSYRALRALLLEAPQGMDWECAEAILDTLPTEPRDRILSVTEAIIRQARS